MRGRAFAVLAFLAQRPGRPVSREELIDAVWPGLIVTDDTLAQNVAELRRALGDTNGSLVVSLPDGYCLEPRNAPGERRHARGIQAFRWRWKYGIIAPFVVAIVFAIIWLATSPNGLSTGAATPYPAIAVLPFQNLGEDGDEADRFTQGLILELEDSSLLAVKPWVAVDAYKGALSQPGEIARVLEVGFQITGSLRHDGERLRANAQMVDAQGKVLWSARYEVAASETTTLQERMVREIVQALAGQNVAR